VVNRCALGRKEIIALMLLLHSMKSVPSAGLIPTLALELLLSFPSHSKLSLKGWKPRLQWLQ